MRISSRFVACLVLGMTIVLVDVDRTPAADRSDVLRKYVSRLESKDKKERWYAAIQVARLGDPRALPIFVEIFSDGDVGMRYHAAREIGNIEDETKAYDFLCSISIEEQDKMVSSALVYQYGHFINNPKTLKVIARLLRGENLPLALAAAGALGEITTRDIIPQMEEFILDDSINLQVREQLLLCLRRAAIARIESALKNIASNSKEKKLRNKADRLRVEIAGLQRGAGQVANERNVRSSHKISSTPEERKKLRGMIRGDTSKDGKLAAMRKLGLLRDSDSVQALMDLYKESSDPEIQGSILVTLAQIGDKRAVSLAQEARNAPNQFVADMAKLALEKLHGHE